MRFGMFSNGQRIYNVGGSFDEDLHEILTAEEVGLEVVWISEHTGHRWLPMGLPAPELLITKAAALTERIRFGTAVKRIALYPPQMTAIEGAVTDHLTHGRYNFGFGVGPPITRYEQWGIPMEDAEARTLEALELILKCWHEAEPFDFNGRFFSGRDIAIYPKLYQKRLPIAVASGRRKMLELIAREGGEVLTTWSFGVDLVRQIATTFDEACADFGGRRRRDLVVARVIYVADTDEKALREIEPYFTTTLAENAKHMQRASAAVSPTLSQVTTGQGGWKSLLEQGNVIAGSPATVIDGVRRLYQDLDGFGTLLLVGGRDFATLEQRDNSLRLFAESVAPKLKPLGERTKMTRE